MECHGKKVWFIPDAYYAEHSTEAPYISHESVCVLNPGDREARIDIILFYEDREPLEGFFARCGGKRTNHIRLDKIRNEEEAVCRRGFLTPYTSKAQKMLYASIRGWIRRRYR
jgi:hypothetical protein